MDQTRKIQKARADKPFRPLGVPSYCGAMLSALQRLPSCKKLRATPACLPNQANIEFRIGRQDYVIYPDQTYPQIAIWNRTTAQWELYLAPIERFFSWQAEKKQKKFDWSLIIKF